ncbi:MAG: hypothetical protein EHM65_01950 [Acidobacteriales bacterium]|nr:MAG: hypothetical protein EHM65_01950 [Terriglobales bacterium]
MGTYLVVAILGLALLAVGFARVVAAYLRFRGKRVVTCPATEQPAAVELAAGHAALRAAFRQPALHLRNCSRWAAQPDCCQACLKQIESAPKECLVLTILSRWFHEKSCTYCGRPMGEINWRQHKPCLASPELRILEWKDIQPETIPSVLQSHLPVCWNCYVAETHTS